MGYHYTVDADKGIYTISFGINPTNSAPTINDCTTSPSDVLSTNIDGMMNA